MLQKKYSILLLSLLSTIFLACDNTTVSRAEYEEALSRADSLEARCDELELELSDLRLYNDYLEGEMGEGRNK